MVATLGLNIDNKFTMMAGATSQSIEVFIGSSLTAGAGLTGLAFNTAGLTAYYAFPASASAAITLATQTNTGAYSSGGFVEKDATNMPGYYRLDLPNAVIAAASGRAVRICMQGAANMQLTDVLIELTAYNDQSATNLGLSALPTANPGASNGVLIAGTNVATTIQGLSLTGVAGSGASAGTVGLNIAGGAGGTTGASAQGVLIVGGVAGSTSGAASEGIKVTGGAAAAGSGAAAAGANVIGGAASTTGAAAVGLNVLGGAGAASSNGAAGGAAIAGGGTNTVASTATGLKITGTSTGHGFDAESGAGASGDGMHITSNATNGYGIKSSAAGTGHGIGGLSASSGNGIYGFGGTSGNGIEGLGGSASGAGILAAGFATNAIGFSATGTGTNAGASITGGGTGNGITITGGATSGDGINITTTSGNGLTLAPTSGHGISTAGNGTTKHGINATGGATTSHGIFATGGGVGHGIYGLSGTGASGDGIRGTSQSTNGNGANFTGVGTGAGLLSTGGATGNGFSIVGGATSGDCISQTTAGTGKTSVAANALLWASGTIPTPNVTGVPLVDDKYLLGTIYSTPATAGIQDINVKNISNAAVSASSAQIGVNLVNWNGTAATSTVPPDSIMIRSGTAQAGGGSTITLDAGASATNNLYQNQNIYIRGGTGVGQSNIILSYVGSTKVATVANAWATNPDNTSTFTILATGSAAATLAGTVNANVIQWSGTNVASPATAGIPEVNVKNINNQAAAAAAGVTFPASIASPTNITAGTIATVTGAVGSVTGNVGGNVVGTVASVVGAVGSVTAAVAITSNIKKNNAANGFMFTMYNATTGAPMTGLTVTGQVAQDGGAFGATTNAPTEIANGWYTINLAAADTNCNKLALLFTATGAKNTNLELFTQP